MDHWKNATKADTEIVRRIHHVDFHELIEVGEDKDGLGMVEIRAFDDGKQYADLRMSLSSAEHVAQAILDCVRELKEQGK